MNASLRIILAEIVGTFFLLLAGTGAVVVNHETQGAVTHVGIALIWGLTVMVLASAFGPVSGAHLNSAVSVGLLAAGKFPGRRLAIYLAAQLIGAMAASILLSQMFPADPTLGATLPHGAVWRSFVLEVIMTFMLLYTILSFCDDPTPRRHFAPLAVGAVIGVEALFAGPISGASMNPTRSIAPAVVSGHLEHLWMYILAPLVGAILAGWLHRATATHKAGKEHILDKSAA